MHLALHATQCTRQVSHCILLHATSRTSPTCLTLHTIHYQTATERKHEAGHVCNRVTCLEMTTLCMQRWCATLLCNAAVQGWYATLLCKAAVQCSYAKVLVANVSYLTSLMDNCRLLSILQKRLHTWPWLHMLPTGRAARSPGLMLNFNHPLLSCSTRSCITSTQAHMHTCLQLGNKQLTTSGAAYVHSVCAECM